MSSRFDAVPGAEESQLDASAFESSADAGKKRWRRRLIGLAVTSAVVVLVLGSVLVVRAVVVMPRFAPEAVVGGYFEALAERDLDAALELIAPETVAEALRQHDEDSSLLFALAESEYEPPRDVEVVDVTVDGRHAVAEVRYHSEAGEHAGSIRLQGGKGLGHTLVPRWRLLDAFGIVDLSAAPTREVSINGLPVRTHDQERPRHLPLLLGSHQVRAGNSPLITSDPPLTVGLEPGGTTGVGDLPVEVSRLARIKVQDAALRAVSACADPEPPMQFPCPYPEAKGGSVITSYPLVEYEPVLDDAGDVKAVSLETIRPGEAQVPGPLVAVTITFAVAGELAVQDGSIELDAVWTSPAT